MTKHYEQATRDSFPEPWFFLRELSPRNKQQILLALFVNSYRLCVISELNCQNYLEIHNCLEKQRSPNDLLNTVHLQKETLKLKINKLLIG